MKPRTEYKIINTIFCVSTLFFITMTWYSITNIQQSFMMSSYYEVCKDEIMLLVNMIGLVITLYFWGKL